MSSCATTTTPTPAARACGCSRARRAQRACARLGDAGAHSRLPPARGAWLRPRRRGPRHRVARLRPGVRRLVVPVFVRGGCGGGNTDAEQPAAAAPRLPAGPLRAAAPALAAARPRRRRAARPRVPCGPPRRVRRRDAGPRPGRAPALRAPPPRPPPLRRRAAAPGRGAGGGGGGVRRGCATAGGAPAACHPLHPALFRPRRRL